MSLDWAKRSFQKTPCNSPVKQQVTLRRWPAKTRNHRYPANPDKQKKNVSAQPFTFIRHRQLYKRHFQKVDVLKLTIKNMYATQFYFFGLSDKLFDRDELTIT